MPTLSGISQNPVVTSVRPAVMFLSFLVYPSGYFRGYSWYYILLDLALGGLKISHFDLRHTVLYCIFSLAREVLALVDMKGI